MLDWLRLALQARNQCDSYRLYIEDIVEKEKVYLMLFSRWMTCHPCLSMKISVHTGCERSEKRRLALCQDRL